MLLLQGRRHLVILDAANAKQLADVDPLAGLPHLLQQLLKLLDCTLIPGTFVGQAATLGAQRSLGKRILPDRAVVEQFGNESSTDVHVRRVDVASVH